MRQHSVLIIDDDKMWLSVISKVFRHHGYGVYTAMNGAEGVKQAVLHAPDVIILDFHLANESAVEVCHLIRLVKDLQNIPIVIASNDETIDMTAYLECGAVSFVIKMGDLQRILANVANVIRHMERASGIVEKGDIRLEPDGFQVYKNHKPLTCVTEEQFKFLALLVNRSPEFVREAHIAKEVFGAERLADKNDAIRALAHRARKSLGLQTGRRIKSKIDKGWIYVLPRAQTAPK